MRRKDWMFAVVIVTLVVMMLTLAAGCKGLPAGYGIEVCADYKGAGG